MFSNVHARAVNIRTGIPFNSTVLDRSYNVLSTLISNYPQQFLSLIIIQCTYLMFFLF